MKPRLFLDIDGVIYAHYAGQWQIRPYTVSLVAWAAKHFDIYWASWNSRRAQVVQVLYAEGIVCETMSDKPGIPPGKFPYIEAYGGLEGDWLFIEDTPPSEAEARYLSDRGILGRYIVVPDTGGDVLLDVKVALEGWIKDRKIVVPADWIRPISIAKDLCTVDQWTGYKGEGEYILKV